MGLEGIDRVRRNHALEHGTVAVLLDSGVRPPLAGYATRGGYFIYGNLTTAQVTEASERALRRLQSGESDLAVSPHCGTNIVVGALLAGLVAAVLMGRSRSRLSQIPTVAFAVVSSTMLGRPLGEAVQRRYTTLPDLEGVEITRVTRHTLGSHTVHRVHTSGPS